MAASGNFLNASLDSCAVALTAGSFPEFDNATRPLKSWFGRLHFFASHDIDTPEKNKAHLLTLCGEQTYETVCTLVHPKTTATVSYNELVAPLTGHFDRRPFEVCNRTLSHRQSQLPDKSVTAYTAALRKLAAELVVRRHG